MLNGPLRGVKVIEIAGLGPAPFAAMMLADMGAEVLRIDRFPEAGGSNDVSTAILNRGRRSISIDLKHPQGIETVLRLAEQADALIEGFRPGVMERLGIGPDACIARNPRLVFGRMTGWGQEGPLSQTAAHDINYIGLSGVLHMIGRANDRPVPPANLVADFGGGGMLLAFGIACALLEARNSGRGQVVDAAMIDGASLLTTLVRGLAADNDWIDDRGVNLFDGGAPFYDTYETADGRFIAVGAFEQRFYDELVRLTGFHDESGKDRMDRTNWPALSAQWAAMFRTKTRDEWCALLEGTDTCFSPVLSLAESVGHPHNRARSAFVDMAGVMQPAPAPRFSRTPGDISSPPPTPGQHSVDALVEWGIEASDVQRLIEAGAISQASTVNAPGQRDE